jgi:hypothetical protein
MPCRKRWLSWRSRIASLPVELPAPAFAPRLLRGDVAGDRGHTDDTLRHWIANQETRIKDGDGVVRSPISECSPAHLPCDCIAGQMESWANVRARQPGSSRRFRLLQLDVVGRLDHLTTGGVRYSGFPSGSAMPMKSSEFSMSAAKLVILACRAGHPRAGGCNFSCSGLTAKPMARKTASAKDV